MNNPSITPSAEDVACAMQVATLMFENMPVLRTKLWENHPATFLIAQRVAEETRGLREAALKVIEMNRQHAHDEFGNADKAEGWGCVVVLRAALHTPPTKGEANE